MTHPLAALLACATLSLIAMPAAAQQIDYTSDDEIALQDCIEAVRDGFGEPGAPDATACIGAASALCQEEPGGASTLGISECNQRETAWWDQWLNANYTELRDGLDPDLAETLRSAQRAWIAWRDADCSFAYDYWAEGSIRVIVHSGCMMDQTARRAIDLASYLDEGM